MIESRSRRGCISSWSSGTRRSHSHHRILQPFDACYNLHSRSTHQHKTPSQQKCSSTPSLPSWQPLPPPMLGPLLFPLRSQRPLLRPSLRDTTAGTVVIGPSTNRRRFQ
ncbi:uncharacterized protein SEPMUDRAFT_136104 [Sphaerulina musiva SO2202]|uniref:Uncharacterized protein n=1 Tax=Sphaerulina musiva (strain SO2202) TaxID=692275 RepID=M3BRH2_SPHMS|nr:uncharacterized protein SEPMUDRAFT_136104 [Sphaerulina musiva SO2202]EMF08723.1 hypothetical protein SEPMUDRAFT_136104 [Sphaerulina musiva SO2202]